MDVYFNELSIKQAPDTATAIEWMEKLFRLCRFIERIAVCVDRDNVLLVRTTEDFLDKNILSETTIRDLLHSDDLDDAFVQAFLAMHDTPHIKSNDPRIHQAIFTNLSIKIEENIFEQEETTGVCAANITDSLIISFDNDPLWDTCALNATVTFYNKKAEVEEMKMEIRHACKPSHIKDCHLLYLRDKAVFPKERFNCAEKDENLLFLMPIYELQLLDKVDEVDDLDDALENAWDAFYGRTNQNQKIALFRDMAKHIADIQKWTLQPQLKNKNGRRSYFKTANDFYMGIDTQEGEWEVHNDKKTDNWLGALTFNRTRFKCKNEDNRKLHF